MPTHSSLIALQPQDRAVSFSMSMRILTRENKRRILSTARPGCRQFCLQVLRQFAAVREAVLRDAHRLVHVPQRIFDDHFIPALAKDEADGRPVVGVPQLIVNGGEIEFILPANSGLNSSISDR